MKKLQRYVILSFLLVLLAAQVIAQQSSHSIVIHAGHVLDVKTGRMLSDQTLVIEGGKIVGIGASAETKAPADTLRKSAAPDSAKTASAAASTRSRLRRASAR